MADVTLKTFKIGLNGENKVYGFDGTEISPGFYNPLIALQSVGANKVASIGKTSSDTDLLLLVQATGAGTLKFDAGDGPFAGEAFEIAFESGLNAICIDSGRFRHAGGVTDTNRHNGEITFAPTAAVTVGVVEHH